MKPPFPPARDIPPGRKALYHAGMAVGLAGLLLFGSTFVTFAANFGNFDDFEGRTRSIMYRAIGGMALMIASPVIMGVAAAGLAGSGMTLDPKQARRDLEPWNRMQGGMIGDVLDEVPLVREVVDRLGGSGPAVEVVRVRCPKCRALNDEHDKFCGQCGGPL